MNENFYETAESYLENELPQAEKLAFEQTLSHDNSIAAEFALFRKVKESLTNQVQHETTNQELEKTLNGLTKEFFQKKAAPETEIISFYQKYKWTIIAVAALLILTLGFYFLIPQPPLYQQFAQHTEASFVVRGNSNQIAFEAEQAFNQQDYTTALAKLESLIQAHPEQNEYLLYKGICLLELNQPQTALAIFQTLQNGKSLFKNEGQWYVALTWLQLKEFEKCQNVVEKIPEGSEYFEQAQMLLREIGTQ